MNKSATVYIYGIFFNDSNYCYIGSTRKPDVRYAEHLAQLNAQRHTNFMQNVYNKHGIRKFVVFRQTTTEEHRLDLEQQYFDFFAKHGWHLVNAILPKQSSESYEFAGMQHHRQLLSKASRRRYARHSEHDKIAANTRIAMMSNEVRSKISERCKAKWQSRTDDERRALYNAVRNKKVANGLHKSYVFFNALHVKSRHVFKYVRDAGKFQPWMHFVIQDNDNVIVFAWDTRIVQFQCNKADLPIDYVKARHDSHEPLVFTEHEDSKDC